MFCSHCGAAGQDGRFCSACGTALRPGVTSGSEPQSPSAHREVNVTVNVGGPVVVPSPQPPSVVEDVARLAKAARDRRRETIELRRQQRVVLQQAMQRHLTKCDEAIADIESTIALEFHAYDSSLRQRYMRALEARHIVAKRFDTPATKAADVELLMQLNDALLEVLQDLDLTRKALAAPPETP